MIKLIRERSLSNLHVVRKDMLFMGRTDVVSSLIEHVNDVFEIDSPTRKRINFPVLVGGPDLGKVHGFHSLLFI